MNDTEQSYIVEYSDEYDAAEIIDLLQNVPGIEVDEVLFANSKLDLRFVVLIGDEQAIEQLSERDEFVDVEPDRTGVALSSTEGE